MTPNQPCLPLLPISALGKKPFQCGTNAALKQYNKYFKCLSYTFSNICRPYWSLFDLVDLFTAFSNILSAFTKFFRLSRDTFSPFPSDCSRMQVSKEGNDISDVSEIWEVRSISLRTGDYNRQCMASEIARKVGK